MYNFKKNNQKGFTLAELLIVVAIIAVLIAIMIPTFGGQLEKARESADLANLRAAYAEATIAYINDAANGNASAPYANGSDKDVTVRNCTFAQTDTSWTSTKDTDSLPFDINGQHPVKTNKCVTFTFSSAGTVKVKEITDAAPSGAIFGS